MSNIRSDALKAKNILATHKGRIQERLIAAGRTGVVTYNKTDLPEHLREDYEDVVKRLTQGSENGTGDGSVAQTISGVSEDEAVDIAGELMNFIHNLISTPRSEFF